MTKTEKKFQCANCGAWNLPADSKEVEIKVGWGGYSRLNFCRDTLCAQYYQEYVKDDDVR